MIFGEWLFLMGILAAGLPVLLHMFHRHKTKKVPFSTLRFLQSSVKRTRHRKIFEDVLLLLIRVAILILLAIGLADPILRSMDIPWQHGKDKAVVIILDNSASMGTLDAGTIRFEKARQSVEEILKQVKGGDSVALLPTGGPRREKFVKLYHQKETVIRALEECKLSYERADLASKIEQAKKLLAESTVPNKEIYVVTDNQALSWEGLSKKKESPAASDQVPILVVNLNKEPEENIALSNVRLDSYTSTKGARIVRATVEITNTSSLTLDRRVNLEIGGKKQRSEIQNIPANSTITYEFPSVLLDQATIHRGEVYLTEEDGCSLDDRLFVVNVDQPISVAILQPKSFIDEAHYLKVMLKSTGKKGYSFRAQPLEVADLETHSLADYPVVFCVNLPALDVQATAKLREYVQAGGHLFWICGDNVDADSYNKMNQLAEGDLLPATLASLRDAVSAEVDYWHVISVDKNHPAFQTLTDSPAFYTSVVVNKYFPLKIANDAKVRTIALLKDGDPFLVEKPVGKGSILMLATSAYRDWTNFPLQNIFLPLMTQLTFYLAEVDTDRSQIVAGSALPISLPGQADGVGIKVVYPPKDRVKMISDLPEPLQTYQYPDTHEVGIYVVSLTNTEEKKQWAFAVNPDPDESSSDSLSSEELQQQFGEQPLIVLASPDEIGQKTQDLREGQSLWELVLGGVLLCLLLEAYLANSRSRTPK